MICPAQATTHKTILARITSQLSTGTSTSLSFLPTVIRSTAYCAPRSLPHSQCECVFCACLCNHVMKNEELSLKRNLCWLGGWEALIHAHELRCRFVCLRSAPCLIHVWLSAVRRSLPSLTCRYYSHSPRRYHQCKGFSLQMKENRILPVQRSEPIFTSMSITWDAVSS